MFYCLSELIAHLLSLWDPYSHSHKQFPGPTLPQSEKFHTSHSGELVISHLGDGGGYGKPQSLAVLVLLAVGVAQFAMEHDAAATAAVLGGVLVRRVVRAVVVGVIGVTVVRVVVDDVDAVKGGRLGGYATLSL